MSPETDEPGGVVDQFSAVSAEYAQFRPRYPRALFAWIASVASRRELAWDCATGNGQAALGLADDFARVIATDASTEQLRHATPHPRVTYRQATADASGIEAGTADVVTVAQALHWLPRDRFYAEAQRVLRRDGVLVAWGYHKPRIGVAEVDRAIEHFHDVVIGPYWRPERQIVRDRFTTIDFPFDEIAPPQFEIQQPSTLERFAAYLRTQSATERYRQVHPDDDPVVPFEREVEAAWGGRGAVREVIWAIFLRAGRVATHP